MIDKFLFCTMLSDSSGTYFRYDLHSGIKDTIGDHDDLAICVEYCDETCKLPIFLVFSFIGL